jgi:hypothetical protein
MKNGFMKSLSDSKNMKYTTVNVAFCALIIAIVMIVNAMLTVFTEKFNWYLDMTDEKIFTMSDDMKGALDEMFEDNDVEIEIIFAAPYDTVKDAFATSSTAGSIGYVNATAEDLALKYDNISLSYHDIRKEYNFYKENFYTDAGTPLSQNVVIVARKNADGTYGEYRVLHYQSFYTFDYSTDELYGYNGEMTFTSSILSLVLDKTPTVYFTIGHGETAFKSWGKNSVAIDTETILTSEDINPNAKALFQLFVDNGYNVKPIDLRTENVPSDARVIVINQPEFDFSTDETAKLRAYYRNSGTVFCFAPYNADLPNLYEFAEAQCGIKVNPVLTGSPVIDPSTLLANKDTFLSTVPDNNATSQYFKTIKDFASAKAIIGGAASLTINPLYNNSEGYEEKDYTMYSMPLLTTSEYAELDGVKGVYNLMAVTSAVETNKINQRHSYSYFLMCAVSDFASNENLSKSNAANNKMMDALIHTLAAREDTPSLVDIDFKTFINYELEITQRQARTITILITTVIPVACIIYGAVTIRRRKLR